MPCMSSPLMLRWAPHVKHAFLGIECTEYPGITAFMAAAACLGKARIMFPNQYLRNDSFARSTSIKVYCYDKGSSTCLVSYGMLLSCPQIWQHCGST